MTTKRCQTRTTFGLIKKRREKDARPGCLALCTITHAPFITAARKVELMLPMALVLEIRRLLDQGELSQRTIARRLGVSRGTVADMVHGRRGDYGRNAAADGKSSSTIREAALPVRCPDCGGLIYAPCRLCDAREMKGRILAFKREQAKPGNAPRRAA